MASSQGGSGTPALLREARLAQEEILLAAQDLLGGLREAEDLAQEAWLLYQREPSGRVRNAASWLRTAVAHLAKRVHQRNRLRAERERIVARPERTPSVLEQLESTSVREHLAAAVAALRDPYREVVARRYLEGCRIEEIAARFRRSPGTVRSQLKRGLDLLRTRLGEDADRSTEGAPLTPSRATGETTGTSRARGLATFPEKPAAGRGASVPWGRRSLAGDPHPPRPGECP